MNNAHYRYVVRSVNAPVSLSAEWDSPEWSRAEVMTIGNFRKESSLHRPLTQCRMLHDDQAVYGLFQVCDHYVQSLHTNFQDQVCKDSCVEFFVEPAGGKGYLNLEMNCGGTFLLYHVIDHTRGEKGFKDYRVLTEADVAGFEIFHTLPKVVSPQIQKPTIWRVGFKMPFAIFERTTGFGKPVNAASWRANFYKCGDSSEFKHWGSWAPVEELNFHRPEDFGTLVLE